MTFIVTARNERGCWEILGHYPNVEESRIAAEGFHPREDLKVSLYKGHGVPPLGEVPPRLGY